MNFELILRISVHIRCSGKQAKTLGIWSRQPYATVTVCRSQLDLAFLLDISGSMAQDGDDPDGKWPAVLDLIDSFLDNLNVGLAEVRVSVVTFSLHATVVFYLDQFDYVEHMKQAIRMVIPTNEATDTGVGLRVVREEVFSKV